MKLSCTGIIFDLDGTLLDSMFVWSYVDQIFLSKRGLTVPDDYGEQLSHLTFRETAEYTIRRFALQEEPEAVMREWNEMAEQAYREHVQMKPWAREFLLRLRDREIPFGVCTALSPELFLPALDHHGITDWFRCIVTTDEVGSGKDKPAPFLETARQLGTDPAETLVFEDVPAAAQGAKDAGMRVIGIADDPKFEPEMRRICDAFLPDYSSLL